MTARHWAHDLIGLTDVGECWGLVCMALRRAYGVELPDVIASQNTAAAVRDAARRSGWRPASMPAEDGDILVMRGEGRGRHVGLAVLADGRVECLHWSQGEVVYESWGSLRSRGFREFEIWRRAK